MYTKKNKHAISINSRIRDQVIDLKLIFRFNIRFDLVFKSLIMHGLISFFLSKHIRKEIHKNYYFEKCLNWVWFIYWFSFVSLPFKLIQVDILRNFEFKF